MVSKIAAVKSNIFFFIQHINQPQKFYLVFFRFFCFVFKIEQKQQLHLSNVY